MTAMDKRKGLLNISVSLGFKILMMVVVIIVKRYLIQFCGNEVNGLNSLYVSIIGFLSVAELGVGSAITFCMYKPIVEEKKETVAALYHLFNKIYLIVGAIVLTSGLVLVPFIPFLAKDYDSLDVNLYVTFFLMLISVVLTYGYSAKSSLIIAHKNNYITTAISSSGMLLQYGLQILVLFLTRSFEWYLICRIISALAQGIATNMIVRKKYRDILTGERKKLDADIKNGLLKSIKSMFMHKIGGLLVNTVDSLVISIFVGVVVLGEYSNYVAIVQSVTNIIALVFTSITSILGHLYVESNKDVARKYSDAFHLLNFILGMIFYLGYYSVADNLISILFSPDLVIEKSLSLVIAMNGFVQFMRKSTLTFRDATGTFYYDRWKPLAEGAANIVLSVLFVNWIGVMGVIVATIITNLFICHMVEPYVLYKHAFSVSPMNYYKNNYLMICCFFAALLLLDCCMQSCKNIFVELLINGTISICISVPICLIAIVLKRKTCGQIFMHFLKRKKN